MYYEIENDWRFNIEHNILLSLGMSDIKHNVCNPFIYYGFDVFYTLRTLYMINFCIVYLLI